MDLDTLAKRLEALGNVTRLAVFRALVRTGRAGAPVGYLQRRLGVPGSTLSHHLRKLIEVGLVTQERQATTLICRADFEAMTETLGFLGNECCRDLPLCASAAAEDAAAEDADRDVA
ncbi:MAG: helix-turn-helix transcriptional regulator [Rhodospirillaceae bacterium]|nr:helix-turn-helix transcriptional regulator [Rhodospirillaceae bacterium]